MAAVNDQKKCCYCGGCIIVCPAQAIELLGTAISIDKEKCTSCGNCVKVCPVGAMRLEE